MSEKHYYCRVCHTEQYEGPGDPETLAKLDAATKRIAELEALEARVVELESELAAATAPQQAQRPAKR